MLTPEQAFQAAYEEADGEDLATLEAGAAMYDRAVEEHPELARRCQWTVKGGFTWCPEHGRYLLKCRR